MIVLASTSDSIRLVTDKAANIDVHASWADLSGSTVTLDRTNTLITTATTTTIIGSPGASTYRTAKTIVIRNRSTLAESKVTIIHRDSTPTDVEMIRVRLSPGDTFSYDEHDGWKYLRGPYGTIAEMADLSWINPTAGVLYTTVLSQDISNANVTANRMIDVPELRFPVIEDGRYWFRFNLMYTAAATATGARFSIYGPGSPTALRYQQENSLSTTTKTSTEGHNAYDLPAAAAGSSAATGSNFAYVAGFIDTPTCNGEVFLRFASEITASAITVLKGSCLQWQRVT